MQEKRLIETLDPRGIYVYCTTERWYEHILMQHDDLEGNESQVENVIKNPSTIYGSSNPKFSERDVYHGRADGLSKKQLRVITKPLDGQTQEVVSAFPVEEMGDSVDKQRPKYIKPHD